MYEPVHIFIYKLWWLILGILIMLTALVGSSILIPTAETSASAASKISSNEPVRTYDSANVITNSMSMAAYEFAETIDSAGQSIDSSGQAVTMNISRSGGYIARGLSHGVASIERVVNGRVMHIAIKPSGATTYIGSSITRGGIFVAQGVKHSLEFTFRSVGSSIASTLRLPINILGSVSHTSIVSAAIKPADNTPIPIINASPATHIEKGATVPSAQPITQPVAAALPNATPEWPIHGTITTGFGVPHWPYQPTHTGIDISDGHRAGITPVRTFKPGRVVETIHSYSGLGNHVTVDHGGGIISIYGHLASISVQTGQQVDKTAVLGLEGSTGASTGTHLHFEIRVNGQPVNPLQYINGRL